MKTEFFVAVGLLCLVAITNQSPVNQLRAEKSDSQKVKSLGYLNIGVAYANDSKVIQKNDSLFHDHDAGILHLDPETGQSEIEETTTSTTLQPSNSPPATVNSSNLDFPTRKQSDIEKTMANKIQLSSNVSFETYDAEYCLEWQVQLQMVNTIYFKVRKEKNFLEKNVPSVDAYSAKLDSVCTEINEKFETDQENTDNDENNKIPDNLKLFNEELERSKNVTIFFYSKLNTTLEQLYTDYAHLSKLAEDKSECSRIQLDDLDEVHQKCSKLFQERLVLNEAKERKIKEITEMQNKLQKRCTITGATEKPTTVNSSNLKFQTAENSDNEKPMTNTTKLPSNVASATDDCSEFQIQLKNVKTILFKAERERKLVESNVASIDAYSTKLDSICANINRKFKTDQENTDIGKNNKIPDNLTLFNEELERSKHVTFILFAKYNSTLEELHNDHAYLNQLVANKSKCSEVQLGDLDTVLQKCSKLFEARPVLDEKKVRIVKKITEVQDQLQKRCTITSATEKPATINSTNLEFTTTENSYIEKPMTSTTQLPSNALSATDDCSRLQIQLQKVKKILFSVQRKKKFLEKNVPSVDVYSTKLDSVSAEINEKLQTDQENTVNGDNNKIPDNLKLFNEELERSKNVTIILYSKLNTALEKLYSVHAYLDKLAEEKSKCSEVQLDDLHEVLQKSTKLLRTRPVLEEEKEKKIKEIEEMLVEIEIRSIIASTTQKPATDEDCLKLQKQLKEVKTLLFRAQHEKEFLEKNVAFVDVSLNSVQAKIIEKFLLDQQNANNEVSNNLTVYHVNLDRAKQVISLSSTALNKTLNELRNKYKVSQKLAKEKGECSKLQLSDINKVHHKRAELLGKSSVVNEKMNKLITMINEMQSKNYYFRITNRYRLI